MKNKLYNTYNMLNIRNFLSYSNNLQNKYLYIKNILIHKQKTVYVLKNTINFILLIHSDIRPMIKRRS